MDSNIIILGANAASESLTELLNRYGHDLTIVEKNAAPLQSIASRHDVCTVLHYPSHPKALLAANINPNSVVIALTDSDETNFTGCHVAKSLQPVKAAIACFQKDHYLWEGNKPKYAAPFTQTVAINQSIYEDIQYMIDHPTFAHINKLSSEYYCASSTIHTEHKLYDMTLDEVKNTLPKDMIISGLYRNNEWIKYRKNIKLTKNDVLLMLIHQKQLDTLKLQEHEAKLKNILILGISHITEALCTHLKKKYTITIVEQDISLCETLASKCPDVNIINDDPQDQNVLLSNHIDKSLVIAASKDDEDNLIYSFQAHDSGAKKVFTLINKIRHGHIFEKGPINYAIIEPQIITDHIIRDLLQQKNVYRFFTKQNFIQIAELYIGPSHPYCDKTIGELKLPQGIYIGGIIRNDDAFFTTHSTKILEEDLIVCYSSHKKSKENPLERLLLPPNKLF